MAVILPLEPHSFTVTNESPMVITGDGYCSLGANSQLLKREQMVILDF